MIITIEVVNDLYKKYSWIFFFLAYALLEFFDDLVEFLLHRLLTLGLYFLYRSCFSDTS